MDNKTKANLIVTGILIALLIVIVPWLKASTREHAQACLDRGGRWEQISTFDFQCVENGRVGN